MAIQISLSTGATISKLAKGRERSVHGRRLQSHEQHLGETFQLVVRVRFL
jgi:hypothetical protein